MVRLGYLLVGCLPNTCDATQKTCTQAGFTGRRAETRHLAEDTFRGFVAAAERHRVSAVRGDLRRIDRSPPGKCPVCSWDVVSDEMAVSAVTTRATLLFIAHDAGRFQCASRSMTCNDTDFPKEVIQ